MNEADEKAAPPKAPRSDAGWARATEALSNVQFRRVFISNMAFFLAMGGQGIVRPWIAFQLTDSTFKLGIVAAAMAIPMFFLSPFGGVFADRIERRKLIVSAQALAMVSEVIVFVLLITGNIEFWHLVAAGAALGCSFPLIMPARSAIVANLVGRQGLGAAMGLNMTGVNVTRVVGPAGAGYLISVIDVAGAYAVNMGLYLVALIVMMTVQKLPPPKVPMGESVLRSMADGFRYLGTDRFVAILLLFGLVPQFLAMPFQNILPAFSDHVWNAGATGYGILHASVGIGAVVGSVYVAWRSQGKPRLDMMLGSIIGFGLMLSLFALSPWFWPAVFLSFIANIGASVFSTLNNVSIQLVIPDHVRGRVSSFMMMSVSLPLLGALPIGWVADQIGAPSTVAIAALMAVELAIAFYLLSPRLRGLDARVHSELDDA